MRKPKLIVPILLLSCAAAAVTAQEKTEKAEAELRAAEAASRQILATPPSVDIIGADSNPAGAAKTKLSAEMQAKLVAFLKTVGKDANGLNLPENRVRYLAEAAALLWRHDQRAAREMFQAATNEFRTVLQSLDALYQQRETGELEDDGFLGGLMGGGMHSGNSEMRFYAVKSARQNLLLTIAEQDGELAFNFMRETAREKFPGWNDAGFEAQLAVVIARSDTNRAFQIAQQKLAKNKFEGLNEIIENIGKKDRAKAAQLAGDTVKKLQTAKFGNGDGALMTASRLFNFAAVQFENKGKETGADKVPLLTETQLRELAEIFAKGSSERLKNDAYAENYEANSDNLEYLKKYAPASAAKLEREMKAIETDEDAPANFALGKTGSTVIPASSPDPTGSSVADEAVVGTATATSVAESKREQQQAQQTEAITKLMTAASDPNNKISVAEARQTLSIIRNRSQRLLAVTQFAKAMALRGDKETAESLLAETDEMQIPQPRKAAEMVQNLLLADAYAHVEPERAFTIVENTIVEFNTVVASFARIGDFIGMKELADNGEFNMSSLPREASAFLANGLGSGFDLNKTFNKLIEADINRTVALADKFDKLEIKVEAKMLIARILLPNDETDK